MSKIKEEEYWSDFMAGKNLSKYSDKILKTITTTIYDLDEFRILQMRNGHEE